MALLQQTEFAASDSPPLNDDRIDSQELNIINMNLKTFSTSPQYRIPARHCHAKCFWFMFCIAVLAVTTGQIVIVVQKYHQYETVVNQVNLIGVDVPFPAITICNVNPYRRSAVIKVDLV